MLLSFWKIFSYRTTFNSIRRWRRRRTNSREKMIYFQKKRWIHACARVFSSLDNWRKKWLTGCHDSTYISSLMLWNVRWQMPSNAPFHQAANLSKYCASTTLYTRMSSPLYLCKYLYIETKKEKKKKIRAKYIILFTCRASSTTHKDFVLFGGVVTIKLRCWSIYFGSHVLYIQSKESASQLAIRYQTNDHWK